MTLAELDHFSVGFDSSMMKVYLGTFLAVGALVFLLSKLSGSSISSSDYTPRPSRDPRSDAPTPPEGTESRGQPAGPAPLGGERRTGLAPPSPRDRRRSLRRKGKPVKVLLSDPATAGTPLVGWVVDRSRGGVALVVPRPLSPGAVFNVMPCDAPEGLEPVRLEVRTCRRKGHRWLAGCKFTSELPWGVLLLFG
jgi:hypothetical protein